MPGRLLAELEAADPTAIARVAEAIGVDPSVLREVRDGKRRLTPAGEMLLANWVFEHHPALKRDAANLMSRAVARLRFETGETESHAYPPTSFRGG